ncbi:MAG: cation:proton antiporter domain-containing protein [Xanthobacteraceae bacterium]
MRRFVITFGLICLAALFVTAAFAAEKAGGGSGEVTFIIQLVLLLAVGRFLGELMERIGQPAIVGQLLTGILLGPTLFGAVWPQAHGLIFPDDAQQKSMIEAVGQLGVLLILLVTGMETDLGLVRQVGKPAVIVSIAGVSVPFGCGFALGEMLPDSILPPEHRIVGAFFLGTALAISSVKIVALVVHEMQFMRRDIGQIIVASAVMEDTIGWIMIAMIFGVASHPTLEVWPLIQSILGTLVFLGLSLTVGRRLMFLLIRWANDNTVGEYTVVTAVLVIMGCMALLTHLIGVHTVLGAFVAGVLVGESPILVKHIDSQLRGMITALFMPVFFGLAGLGADLTVLKDPHLFLLTLGLVAVASVGKFGGAFVGGKVGGLSTREAFALGCAMNARGSTEVIVATIGLSLGVLSQTLFTMILAMAIITTTAMPPMLRRALARLPMRRPERIRLEREEIDAKGVVSKLERLLVAVDDGANGKFASRIAGMLAGFRGMPITVLKQRETAPRKKGAAVAAKDEDAVKKAVASGAEKSAAGTSKDKHHDPKAVDITMKTETGLQGPAISKESTSGYGLLWVGLNSPISPNGAFSKKVIAAAAEFEDAIALVVARGEHHENPGESNLNIYLPVDGTKTSRFAAEIAFIVARASKAEVTAVYVSGRSRGIKRKSARDTTSRAQEKAIVTEIESLGRRYDVRLTTVRLKGIAKDALLHDLRGRASNLIIMGVNKRPGETLFFGDTAEALLKSAKQSFVFVTSYEQN